MLDEVAKDAKVLHMEKNELMCEFSIAYQEVLEEIGFSKADIMRMVVPVVMG